MRDDTAPQIGSYDVDRSALAGEGESVEAALRSVGATTDAVPPGTPEAGWRVLAHAPFGEGTVLLGSPADPERLRWHVAQVAASTVHSPARVSFHPEVQPLRPSIAERRGGLVLRWPAVTRELLDLDALTVDVVNAGGERWLPDGDAFLAIASLVPANGRPGSFYAGWTSAQEVAVPLDPGEYARLPARLDGTQWRDARPGPYLVHAFVPSLRMTTDEPLEVELTAEVIAAHPEPPAPEPASADQERRAIESRLGILRAYRAARERIPEVAAAIRAALSDEEALARVADLLGIGEVEAGAVVAMQLRRLRAGGHDVLALEIDDLEQRLRELG